MAKLSKVEIELLNRLLFTKHVYGLPVAEGVKADIFYDDEGFTISAANMTFGLGYDVVSDICVKTDVEISKQYVSSAAGAVGGAMLFGPIGALIGGRVKEKRASVETKYIIITYTKNSEFNYLCFELTTLENACRGNYRCNELNKMVEKKILTHNKGMVYSLTGDVKPETENIVSTYKANTEAMDSAQAAYKKSIEIVEKQLKSQKDCIGLIIGMIIFAIIVAVALRLASNNLAVAALYLIFRVV